MNLSGAGSRYCLKGCTAVIATGLSRGILPDTLSEQPVQLKKQDPSIRLHFHFFLT
jgi:hypothetical protein